MVLKHNIVLTLSCSSTDITKLALATNNTFKAHLLLTLTSWLE